MGVRLNKVLSELNIGLQTAVDFLKKKNHLGEVKDDVTPNTKISDEQYEALVGEFKGDKAVKTKADMLFVKKPKEKKVEKELSWGQKTKIGVFWYLLIGLLLSILWIFRKPSSSHHLIHGCG